MANVDTTADALRNLFSQQKSAPQAMTPPPGVSLANVPAFQQNAARGLQLVRGHDPDAIAHTPRWGNKIFVDNPALMTQPILDHEVEHSIQRSAGEFRPTNDVAGAAEYDYGGIQGLEALRARHGTIANLNPEKQANITQDYQTQMNAWSKGPITPKVLAQSDRMNAAYGPFLRQQAAQAAPGMPVTPSPPGAPPATLTGMIKPLPEMGGKTLSAERALLEGMNPEDAPRAESYARNKPFAKPGPYVTKLSPSEEQKFQAWVKQNKVPWQDTPDADYDMRGYFRAMQQGKVKQQRSQWDHKMHFVDQFKTPYDATFSNQSQYATADAPRWEGDRLMDKSGQLIVDETPHGKGKEIPQQIAMQYYRKAGNDPARARTLAKQHGWKVSAQ